MRRPTQVLGSTHNGTISDEVLDNLERELRLIVSDDEPLVRPMVGRNGVSRISSGKAIGESFGHGARQSSGIGSSRSELRLRG